MKARELRQRSPEELRIMLRDLRAKLEVMRFELTQGKIKNTTLLKQHRAEIARILTLLRSRRQAESSK